MKVPSRQATWKLAGVASAVLALGTSCDRKSNSLPPATNPSDHRQQVSAPPAVAAQAACLVIDGDRINFPPASLRIETIDDKVVASFVGDDKSKPGTPNSFYFRMNLDADDPHKFLDCDWRCVDPSGNPEESPYGIFLVDPRRQLQPIDAKVTFDKTPDAGITLVSITGKFVETNLDDPAVARRNVAVAAEVEAVTTVKD